MKKYTVLFQFFLISLFFVACSGDDDSILIEDDPINEDPITEKPFENGIFVVNEGGEGSVSFIPNDLSEITHEIFSTINDGEDLGIFVQSMFFDDENAYIISNGSNLITVVNRFTFELEGRIEIGLDIPRYGTVYNGKAYVTNQASFETPDDDYIAVINLETLEVETEINAGGIVEFIEEHNGQLIIQNASYGMGNALSILDPSTNSITQTLEVGEALNSFQIHQQSLYALTAEQLVEVNLSDFSISTEEDLPENLNGSANLQVNDNLLYMTNANEVYTANLSDLSFNEEALLAYSTESQFGSFYGFIVADGRIFIADAGDFASNGKVKIYDLSGNLEADFSARIGPNGFYLN